MSEESGHCWRFVLCYDIAPPKTCCSGSKVLVKGRIFVLLLSHVHCVRVDNGRLPLHSVAHSLAVVMVEEGKIDRPCSRCGGLLVDILMRWQIFHHMNAAAHIVSDAINSSVGLMLTEKVFSLVYRGEIFGLGEAFIVM